MKIAVYPGSFNPLHIGHRTIMEYLTREGAFDWVYLVVSPKNPLKADIRTETGEERYKAAVEAVKRYPGLRVQVDDVELKMPPPQYTIRTLDALRRREPGNEFTLVIGADNLLNIRRWRDFSRILSEYGVAVYPRKGCEIGTIQAQLTEEWRDRPAPWILDAGQVVPAGKNSLEEALRRAYRIQIIDAPIVDISSTEIRQGLAEGKDMSAYLM